MNWEEDAYGRTPTFPTISHDQPPTPTATPKSTRGPTFEAAAFETPRSNLATFESFFPFSTSPLQPLTECYDQELEPGNPLQQVQDVPNAKPPSTPSNAESTPRPTSQRSSAATPKHAPSSQTSVETAQESSVASGGPRISPDTSDANVQEAVFSDQAVQFKPTAPPNPRSATTHIQKDFDRSLPIEEQDDHIQAMQVDYSRYSRRASRYSQFSPDLLEVFGYPVSAPVTAPTPSRQSIFCDPNASGMAEELGAYDPSSNSSQSRRRGSATTERDQASSGGGQMAVSRALLYSSPSKLMHGHPQAVPFVVRSAENAIEPNDLLEISRSRTDTAPVTSRLSLGGSSVTRSFRQSNQPESTTITVRDEAFGVERQTLKPRSNNGAVFSSKQTPLIKAGHKRRYTEEAFPTVRGYSVDGRRRPGQYSESTDGSVNPAASQRITTGDARRSTRMRSNRERAESLEHNTVTFTIDENGRAKAERRPIVNESQSQRQTRANYSLEDGEETDSEASTESDFAIATSRNPSFAVLEESRRHSKRSRRALKSSPHKQPSFASQPKYLDSHSRHLQPNPVAPLISRRTALERASDDRVQARVRANLRSSDHTSALTDDVETEAETIFDDDCSSDSDPDATQTFETGPRRTVVLSSSQDVAPARSSHTRHGRSASQDDGNWTTTIRQHRKGSNIRSYSLNVSPTSILGSNIVPPSDAGHLIGPISIQCICERSNDGGPVIECDSCEKWQHTKCIGLSSNAMPREYICVRCTTRSSQLRATSRRALESTVRLRATSPNAHRSQKIRRR